MPTLEDYKGLTPAWCPGCGNFGILSSLKNALIELGITPDKLLLVSGIGQAAKLPHYLKCNTFNGLHGRSLPVATGAKLANHELIVLDIAGDGDCYGEGGNHFTHTLRRNVNVKLFVHDNQIYGLTKGQASPTSMESTVSKNMPFGVLSEPLNPMALSVAMDASWVGRGYVGDMEQLKGLMKAAILHKGFTHLDILQPCVTFNKINTYEWYKQRVYKLPEDYNPFDRVRAFEKALEFGDKIPTGIIYRNDRQTMEDRIPVIKDSALARQGFDTKKIEETLLEFY